MTLADKAKILKKALDSFDLARKRCLLWKVATEAELLAEVANLREVVALFEEELGAL